MSHSTTGRPLFFQLDEFYLDLSEDNGVDLCSKEEISKNPFPGLRPFKSSEFQLFRGRDGQAEALISRLKRNHFLAVIGSSGTGKSSLIRAGLVPHLLGGYFAEEGSRWNTVICRPGHDPLQNLSVALARIKSRSNEKETILAAYDEIHPHIRDNIYGVLEVAELLNPPAKAAKEKTALLIIVDQFEELFRFNRDDLDNPGIESHFVNLLLKASANTAGSVYVVITMRSEFLGDSVKYRGLPEAINEGQFLVPQLSRNELKEVIEDPIRLAGKKIDAGLVEMLVNEIEQSKLKKDLDQLPVLQHALMRTYGEASKEAGSTEITHAHYKACGGMEKALANHAEAKYAELGNGKSEGPQKQKIVKLVFQALTDAGTDQKGGRRPTELETIYAIAKSIRAGTGEVDEAINHFRDTETSFIMPPLNTPLYPGLIMDISHESLMRRWQRLQGWAEEEAASAQVLTRLMQAQRLYKKDEKDLLKGKELYPVSQWYQTVNPQPAWSERYAPDHQEGFVYLKKSEWAWKWKRALTWILSITAVLALALGFFWWNANKHKSALKAVAERQKQIQKQSLLVRSQEALSNDDSLLAGLLLAEAGAVDTGDKANQKNLAARLPKYFLQSIIKIDTSFSKVIFNGKGDSLFVWDDRQVLYRYDLANEQLTKTPAANHDDILEEPLKEEDYGVQQLYKQWGLNRKGFGQILKFEDGTIQLIKGVPRNIGSFDYGFLSKDKSLFLTSGVYSYGQDKTFSVFLWDLREGKQIGNTLLHTAYIDGNILSADNSRIAIWENAEHCIRVFRKTSFDDEKKDEDLPPEIFNLQLKVATGAETTEQRGIRAIPTEEWKKRKEEWMTEGEKHFRNCRYKEANYWARCYPEKAKSN